MHLTTIRTYFYVVLCVALFVRMTQGFRPAFRSVHSRLVCMTSQSQAIGEVPKGKEPILTTELPYDSYRDIRFCIMGGGAFSLALAKVLSYKKIETRLLVRDQKVADYINENNHHPKYLSECPTPKTMWATSDPSTALFNCTYVVHAVPMQQSRAFLEKNKKYIPEKAPILSVTKGVEQTTFALMNDIIVETLGEDKRAAFLSGPSFAKEIMDGAATAVVIASKDQTLASELTEILSSVEFRCHTSRDVKGVELGGAIKNVIALAAGMCEGLGLGMNAMSSLVTRGCTEMARYV
jgi:glycerol-3-phosphate dehydrogenase (NAD+)